MDARKKLFYNADALFLQSLANLFDVLVVAGFHRHAQQAGVDVGSRGSAFVQHRNHVGAGSGKHVSDLVELTGFVGEL